MNGHEYEQAGKDAQTVLDAYKCPQPGSPEAAARRLAEWVLGANTNPRDPWGVPGPWGPGPRPSLDNPWWAAYKPIDCLAVVDIPQPLPYPEVP